MSTFATDAYTILARLLQAARLVGAKLPPKVTAATDHAHALGSAPVPPSPAELAEQAVREHLGDPAAYAKARDAAVRKLGIAHLGAEFDKAADAVATEYALAAVRKEAAATWTAITAATEANVIAPMRERLADLPAWVRREQVADLTPAAFAAWQAATTAAPVLDTVGDALVTSLGNEWEWPELQAFDRRARRRLLWWAPNPDKPRAGTGGLAGHPDRSVTGHSRPTSDTAELIGWGSALQHGMVLRPAASPAEVSERVAMIAAAEAEARAALGLRHGAVPRPVG